jgi:hypothetical protein
MPGLIAGSPLLIVSGADFRHHWCMGIDPHKAWELFTIDPPDFLAMFALVITAVAIFVWWYRDHLVKERIATNEQRIALAREEQAAVTKQIEVLKPQLECCQKPIMRSVRP